MIAFFSLRTGLVPWRIFNARHFFEEYRSIDFPGATRTRDFGLNAHGDVVGTYVDAANRVHGFLAEVAHKKR